MANNNNNNWAYPIDGAGYVLKGAALPAGSGREPIPDQNTVRLMEPKGSIPQHRIDRTTGFSQVQNLSQYFDLEKIQAAFRSAEQGDTRILFTYYRDFFQGNSIVQSALSSRKRATISEQWKIIPASNSDEDKYAAEVITYVLKNTPKFNDALIHFMNAIVYPVALAEKTFDVAKKNKYGLKYQLTGIHPIDYNIVSYKVAYVPQIMTTGITALERAQAAYGGDKTKNASLPLVQYNEKAGGAPSDYQYNPDDLFEPDLRLWPVLPNGIPVQIPAMMIPLDPNRVMVYRSNLMLGTSRENFGGLGKSLLFLAVMSQVGLQTFQICMKKYGLPFVEINADEEQIDTVNKIIQTFGNMSTVLNAIAVDKDASIKIHEMNMSGAADGHEKFLTWIKDLIYLLVCGEVLSSHGSTGGISQGKGSVQSDVREDVVKFDRLMLAECLRTQLFKYILQWNNIKGEVPSIVWGGTYSAEESKLLSETLKNYSDAGIALPTEEFLETISENLGGQLQMMGEETEQSSSNVKNKEKKNGTKTDTDKGHADSGA